MLIHKEWLATSSATQDCRSAIKCSLQGGCRIEARRSLLPIGVKQRSMVPSKLMVECFDCETTNSKLRALSISV